jgi:hypothetical protein
MPAEKSAPVFQGNANDSTDLDVTWNVARLRSVHRTPHPRDYTFGSQRQQMAILETEISRAISA